MRRQQRDTQLESSDELLKLIAGRCTSTASSSLCWEGYPHSDVKEKNSTLTSRRFRVFSRGLVDESRVETRQNRKMVGDISWQPGSTPVASGRTEE